MPSQHVRLLLALTAMALGSAAAAAPATLTTMDQRGSDLPPVGRSLLDFLLAEEVDGAWVVSVPYPFEALTTSIAAHLRPGFREPIKRVLHPIGRSLHRHTAAPHFFRYPRAVAAVDTDSAPGPRQSGPMLKDRLYLGYQPLSETVEAISYNEAAGRFEYQVISDYREGGTPRLGYTDRGLCLSYHHNQAVIYAGQPWAESNNSVKVAALLRAEADSFYGISAQVAFDIPETFDESTDRANLFAAYQVAWRDACGAAGDRAIAIACRRDGLVAVLRTRLTGGYQLADPGDGQRNRFATAVAAGWRALYPEGLELQSADLADHDPFADAGFATGRLDAEAGLRELAALVTADLVSFDDAYEPLYARAPLAIWTVAAPFAGMPAVEPHWMNTVIAGLGGFLAAADIERLDARLAALGGGRDVTAACTMRRRDGEAAFAFDCALPRHLGLVLKGRLAGDGAGGATGMVDRMRADSAAPGGLTLTDTVLVRDAGGWLARFTLRDQIANLGARTAAGDAVLGISMRWPAEGGVGEAVVTIADDFARLRAAVDALAAATLAGDSDALAAKPFRRVALMRPLFADLGIAIDDWCCLDSGHLPPPRLHYD